MSNASYDLATASSAQIITFWQKKKKKKKTMDFFSNMCIYLNDP